MATIIYIFGIALFAFPAIIFLDFRKRNTVYIAILYLIVFFTIVRLVLPLMVKYGHIYFALSIPFLLVIYLIIAKKRKDKRKPVLRNKEIIDDF